MTTHPFCNGLYHPFMVLYPHYIYIYIQSPTELWKKNVSIYRRRLSMIEKLRTCFFSIIIVSIFFSHNSVGDCMSIDSQFECILRGILNYRKYVSKDLVYAPKSSIDIHNIM